MAPFKYNKKPYDWTGEIVALFILVTGFILLYWK